MLIYIAGYGRSGSTILDTILGNNPTIFGGGELIWLFDNFVRDAVCSCGKTMSSCPVWANVAREIKAQCQMSSWQKASRISRINDVRNFYGSPSASYKELWSATFSAIKKVTGKNIIVDSSKTNHIGWPRLKNLTATYQGQTRVVHLVRDPRAVMWSMSKGTNKYLAKKPISPSVIRGIRGVFSWSLSNTLAELAVKSSTNNSLVIKYEDIMQVPFDAFSTLGQYLELDLQPLSMKLNNREVFSSGHGIAGNRMRSSPSITPYFDDSWKQKLSKHSQRIAVFIGEAKMKRYGYEKTARAN